MHCVRNSVIVLFISLISSISYAQESKELYETARTYMRQGDFANASLVLTRALQQDPQNIDILNDLALDYFFQKEYNKALEVIKPVTDKNIANDQSFQILGNVYKALRQVKDAEKIYKKGIKKFPASGPLYNDYGETLWAQGDVNAIKQWERGIEKDPQFSGNYYNSARYYYFSTDKTWSIIYGEIFLNLETFTSRTSEMKGIVLESYKKLFGDVTSLNSTHDKNSFEASFLENMIKQSPIATQGITPESLTMIRTRFILDWLKINSIKYHFHLFDFHKQLLENGLFDAYNQWIFGVSQNLTAYQNWTLTHPEEYADFLKFQKNRMFKMPLGEYFHK